MFRLKILARKGIRASKLEEPAWCGADEMRTRVTVRIESRKVEDAEIEGEV